MPHGVYERSKEQKERMRLLGLSQKGNKNPFFGKSHSKESREKISIGKKKNPTRYWLGKKRSKETKEKISVANKGQKAWNEGKEMPKGEFSANWKGGKTLDKNYFNKRYKNLSAEMKKDEIWRRNKRNRMKRTNGGLHTLKEWNNLIKEFKNTCPCCKKSEPEIKLTQDHIIPISKGGTDDISNIQPLCGKCNSKKGKKIITFKK